MTLGKEMLDALELRLRHDAKVRARPAFETIYMNFAVGLSARSTCRRLSVGCAIVTPDFRKVLACGFNGNATGLENDCDSDTVGACGCIHSETNAVVNCDAPRGTEKIVFCTHLPCKACAKLLVNLGHVRRVYYLNDYRVRDSLIIFEKTGITATQFDPTRLP